jgi:Ras family protein T1
VPEVTIPPEITPENVTTSIVDTSCEWDAGVPNAPYICIASDLLIGTCFADTPFPANPKSRTHLLSQLSRAHVICLVYSISDPSSFDRVAEYWLPLFRREGINVSGSV